MPMSERERAFYYHRVIKRIATEMDKQGMSRRKLANELGVVSSAVNHWLTGRRYISVIKLIEIARVLGVAPTKFLK